MGEGYRFCGGCGAAVGGCPSCHEPLTPGERFCRACGYALAEITPAASRTADPPAAPVAERRLCSVLFCGVVEKFIGDAVMAVWGHPGGLGGGRGARRARGA